MFYRVELFPEVFFLCVGVCFVPCALAAKICCDDFISFTLSLLVSSLSILSAEDERVSKLRDESLSGGKRTDMDLTQNLDASK